MSENWDERIALLEESAVAGDADAKARLGGVLIYGIEDISEEKVNRGYKLVQEAAREGNYIAQEVLEKFEADLASYHANLHTWTLTMQGSHAESKLDGINAVKFYKAASDEGCHQATSFLGSVYYNGVAGVVQDYGKAAEYFKRAAEVGIMSAQSMLGLCYLHGTGVVQDFEESEKWFLKAIEQGDVEAMNCLADAYEKMKKYPQAEELYRKVIQNPNALEETINNAKTSLGYLYGTMNEHSRAIPLFKEAAQSGQPYAEYGLGCCYQDGLGVEKNLEIALSWFKRSVEHGFPEAQKGVNYIQNELNRLTQSYGQSSKRGGCYIATAVYGSYDCPEVWTLRRFRDGILEKYLLGHMFVKVYYAISPTLVKCFGKQKLFNIFWKKQLDNLVDFLARKGISNAPYNDCEYRNK